MRARYLQTGELATTHLS